MVFSLENLIWKTGNKNTLTYIPTRLTKKTGSNATYLQWVLYEESACPLIEKKQQHDNRSATLRITSGRS